MKKSSYRVMLVEAADAPEGMGGTWHRYVIGEGRSLIEGKKQGTLEDVTAHAELTAEDLNERIKSPSSSNYRSSRTRKTS